MNTVRFDATGVVNILCDDEFAGIASDDEVDDGECDEDNNDDENDQNEDCLLEEFFEIKKILDKQSHCLEIEKSFDDQIDLTDINTTSSDSKSPKNQLDNPLISDVTGRFEEHIIKSEPQTQNTPFTGRVETTSLRPNSMQELPQALKSPIVCGKKRKISSVAVSSANIQSSNNTLPISVAQNNDYIGKNQMVWSKETNFVNTQNRTFQSTFKISDNLKGVNDPSKFFDFMIDDQMLEKIIYYTNKRLPANVPAISLIELRAFIGLLLLFGVTEKGDIDINQIWTPSSVFHSDLASAAMPRERFQKIAANICFDDKAIRPPSDISGKNFYKISEIFNMFRKNISEAVEPGEFLTVDQQLYPFRGRCAFKQYTKSEPDRCGLKLWSIADVRTSYILDTEIYLGEKNDSSQRAENLGANIVLNLNQKYFNSNRTITAGNFFSSVNLASQLWDNGLKYVGAISANKPEIPCEFLADKSRSIGSCLFGFHDHLTLASFVPKKNKSVNIISTYHHEKEETQQKKKLEIVSFYNKNKAGLDTLDNMVESYTCRRKSNRWPLVMFMYMIDVAGINAFALAREAKLVKVSSRSRRLYLENLCTSLIRPLVNERNVTFSSNNYRGVSSYILESIRRVGVKTVHNLSKEKNQEKAQRCSMCVRKIKDTKTTKKCFQCDKYVCANHRVEIRVCNCCLEQYML